MTGTRRRTEVQSVDAIFGAVLQAPLMLEAVIEARHLRVLRAVAATGSFSAAGARTRAAPSPPSASR